MNLFQNKEEIKRTETVELYDFAFLIFEIIILIFSTVHTFRILFGIMNNVIK